MASSDKCGGSIYVVKENDTLYKIASKYQLSVLDLFLANPYVNVYNLQIGDELCIPIKAIPVKEEVKPYRILNHDTIESILKKTGFTFEELAQRNPFLYRIALPDKTIVFLPAKKEASGIRE